MTDNPYINNINGHRERIKFCLRQKQVMSKEGFKNFNYKVRPRVTQIISKWVGSHKDCTKTWSDADKYGVPAELFATNRSTILFLLSEFCLEEGFIYTLNGFSKKKTITHVGFSKNWMAFKITDKESKSFEVMYDSVMKRYWFRKNVKEDE